MASFGVRSGRSLKTHTRIQTRKYVYATRTSLHTHLSFIVWGFFVVYFCMQVYLFSFSCAGISSCRYLTSFSALSFTLVGKGVFPHLLSCYFYTCRRVIEAVFDNDEWADLTSEQPALKIVRLKHMPPCLTAITEPSGAVVSIFPSTQNTHYSLLRPFFGRVLLACRMRVRRRF